MLKYIINTVGQISIINKIEQTIKKNIKTDPGITPVEKNKNIRCYIFYPDTLGPVSNVTVLEGQADRSNSDGNQARRRSCGIISKVLLRSIETTPL